MAGPGLSGRPPRDVLVFGAVLFGISIAVIAVLVWLGSRWHDNTAKYFGERLAGTYYSGALLVAAGVVAAPVGRRARGASARRFWTGAAAGFVFLACDDVFRLHERTDHLVHGMLGWDPDHWLTDPLDDVIVVSYGAADLRPLRWTMGGLAAASLGFVAMVVLDVMGWYPATEEILKILAETMIVVALYAALRDPALRVAPRPYNAPTMKGERS